MKHYYVKTNKAEGYVPVGNFIKSPAELATILENVGHEIIEIRLLSEIGEHKLFDFEGKEYVDYV